MGSSAGARLQPKNRAASVLRGSRHDARPTPTLARQRHIFGRDCRSTVGTHDGRHDRCFSLYRNAYRPICNRSPSCRTRGVYRLPAPKDRTGRLQLNPCPADADVLWRGRMFGSLKKIDISSCRLPMLVFRFVKNELLAREGKPLRTANWLAFDHAHAHARMPTSANPTARSPNPRASPLRWDRRERRRGRLNRSADHSVSSFFRRLPPRCRKRRRPLRQTSRESRASQNADSGCALPFRSRFATASHGVRHDVEDEA